MHTTNYHNAFIAVAEDCATAEGTVPPEKVTPTIAQLQYELIANNPYHYTSDDVIFTVHALRSGIDPVEYPARRAAFFAKGQACLRASPLAKQYGWGIHHDHEGRVAIYPRGSEAYQRFASDPALKQLKAMRSAK